MSKRPSAVAAWRAWLAMLSLLAPLAGALAAVLPPATDLRHDAGLVARRGQPIVILFSMPGCIYCPEVRDNYLAPMTRGEAGASGPIIREVDITSSDSLLDFDGKPVMAKEFSRRYKVRATPTVVMLDGQGKLLAEPLVGSGMAGFYGGYLDAALETARAKLKPDKRT